MTDVYKVEMKTPRWNMLIYGDAGAGKTRLAATSCWHPDMRKVLWLNYEGGLISVADMDMKDEFRPIAMDLHTSADMEETFWKLVNRQQNPALADVHTVVIDNGSELLTLDLEATVGRKLNQETAGGKRHQSLDDVWLDDRGESGRRVARLFRWFRDLDLNVIITAHPRYTYPKNRKGEIVGQQPIDVRPEFPDKLRRHVEGYMDFVWYMYRDASDNRFLLTQPQGAYFAKTRGEHFARQLGKLVFVPMDVPVLAMLYKMLATRAPLPEQLNPSQAGGVADAPVATAAQSVLAAAEAAATMDSDATQ